MPELKTRMGWVTCPKDKSICSIGLHCCLTLEVKTCTHYKGQDKNVLHCTYGEEGKEDESENTSGDIRSM